MLSGLYEELEELRALKLKSPAAATPVTGEPAASVISEEQSEESQEQLVVARHQLELASQAITLKDESHQKLSERCVLSELSELCLLAVLTALSLTASLSLSHSHCLSLTASLSLRSLSLRSLSLALTHCLSLTAHSHSLSPSLTHPLV